jgi:hypothetical protein
MAGYSMTDMASGSNAAMTMMQNMGAAPLAADVGKAQAEAKIAEAEKAKLSNLVTESNFKSSEESKAKLKALVQTPDFKQADQAKQLRMAAAVQMETGDIENGAKTLIASETFDAKQLAAQSSALDLQARQIGNAYSVISAVPDDKVEEYAKQLPPQTLKALVSEVGEANWNRMSGAEKKEAAKNLMLNASKKLASQSAVIEEAKQQKIGESRERVATINANWHMANKTNAGSKEDLATFRAYTNKVASDNKQFTGSESRLTKSISDAKVLYDSAMLTNNTKAAAEAKSEYDSRVADLKDLQKRRLKSDLSNAKMLPDGPQRDRIMGELTKQAEILGIKDDTKPKDTPKSKDTKDDLQGKVEAAGQKYEPSKYDYRVNADGSVQRKAK